MGRSGGVGSNFEDGAVGSSGRSSRRRLGCMGYALPFVSYGIVDILLDEEHLLDDAPLRQHLQRVLRAGSRTPHASRRWKEIAAPRSAAPREDGGAVGRLARRSAEYDGQVSRLDPGVRRHEIAAAAP